MKTLSFLILSFLLSTGVSAKASQLPKTTIEIDSIVTTYINYTTLGKTNNCNKLFDASFKRCISYNGKIVTYNKKQWVDYMNQTKDIVRNCNTNYSWVENNSNFSIAKIEMKYPTFTEVDYLTMSNKNGNWTITNVFSTYE